MSEVIKRLVNDTYDNYILPFFWQHGEDEATLREYMAVIDELNIKAVCIESRPHPDFCGDRWWNDMDIILEEAKNRMMKVWILDDSHFPTGFANGAMQNQPLSKARRSICCQKFELKAGETLSFTAEELKHPAERTLSTFEEDFSKMTGTTIGGKSQAEFEDDKLISIGVVTKAGKSIDITSTVRKEGLSYTAKEPCVVYKMNTTRNRGPHPEYINMIDESSVRVLIDEVYENHYKHYKDYFGNVIAGFFSDEPELGNGHMFDMSNVVGTGFDMDFPWSEELEMKLKEVYQDDFATKLPLIWEQDENEENAMCRVQFMNELTRLVEKNFSYQIGDWCRTHGVEYIGHIIEDNGQHCRTGSTLGHYFRALKGQDWAGIDDIGGQVYPMGENDSYDRGAFQTRNGEFYHFLLGKLANSLAALDPKKSGNAMCEIFGAYGWEEGLRLEKYLADHFMVRGINHFVPHAFSAKDFPDPDCPPHFYAHGHNPEYKAFGELMTYMNRCCELISGGKHIAPVAVMYHAESEWAGGYMPDERVTRVLTENQIDFDIVPQDVFIERDDYKTEIINDKLKINTQEYSAVLVPYVKYLTKEFADALTELVKAGVKVYFVGGKPESIIGKDVDISKLNDVQCIETEDITEAMDTVVDIKIAPANSYIRYYHYVKANTDLYMLVNEGDSTYNGKICIRDSYTENLGQKAYLYDAWDNAFYDSDFVSGNGNICLEPGKSRFIILPKNIEDEKLISEKVIAETILPTNASKVSTATAWVRSITKSKEYPAFKNETEVHFPDDYSKIDREFSGWFKYENSLVAKPGKKYYIEITDAFEVVTLYVNDVKVSTKIFPPFIYDISKYVNSGDNNIRIEIATTLEREMLSEPDMFGRPKVEPKFGSGIMGEINIYESE